MPRSSAPTESTRRSGKILHPDDGGPIYSGVNMWRGVTRWQPYLTGQSYMRAGWLTHGKMVIYPIRNNIDGEGRQLINWVAEVETPDHERQDWNKRGRLEDFIHYFADWHFDFLDVPAMIRAADVDPRIPDGRQGPARPLELRPPHPARRRGASRCIRAARTAPARRSSTRAPSPTALPPRRTSRRRSPPTRSSRLGATAEVVRTNRTTPPDAILREVYLRTGDKPFDRIEDVISPDEMAAITNRYKKIAGYDRQSLEAKRAPADARAAPSRLFVPANPLPWSGMLRRVCPPGARVRGYGRLAWRATLSRLVTGPAISGLGKAMVGRSRSSSVGRRRFASCRRASEPQMQREERDFDEPHCHLRRRDPGDDPARRGARPGALRAHRRGRVRAGDGRVRYPGACRGRRRRRRDPCLHRRRREPEDRRPGDRRTRCSNSAR